MTYFLLFSGFVGSGSNQSFDMDPDPGKLYGSGTLQTRNQHTSDEEAEGEHFQQVRRLLQRVFLLVL